MIDGKMKAVTFRYDDGVTQDIRLIEMLDRYGPKATFNLNSELLGKSGSLDILGKEFRTIKFSRMRSTRFTRVTRSPHTPSPTPI